MDNITHSLTGLFLSRVGLNRLTPNASAILIVSANAPDVDIAALAGGALNYFHFHRHFTHSLVFAPVLAAAAVAAVRIFSKTPLPWLAAFFVALAGVFSHLLLDLTNSYGIRLLLPFSSRWFYGDLNNIYDLWIWAVFAICIVAPLLSRLVGSEIGASSKRIYPGRAFPYAALLFLLVYDGARFALHSRAVATLESRQYDAAAPLRIAALPSGNPLRWQGVAETEAAYRVFDLDLAGQFHPALGQTVFKAEPSPQIEAAGQLPPFRIFRDFARFPVWRTLPAEAGSQVTLSDIGFPFFAEADFDRFGKVKSSRFSYGR